MRSTPLLVLSAVTIVAALGLVGCGQEAEPATSSSQRVTLGTSVPPAPRGAPLPAPDALTDVLYRLADRSIPAEQKVDLVQYATVEDERALTNFGEALAASGFAPLDVQAADLAWAGEPGHVTANVTIGSANPDVKSFTYPMEFSPAEFSPARNTWQLSRRTADQLLPLVAAGRPPR